MNPSNIIGDSISHYLAPINPPPTINEILNKSYSKEVHPETMEELKGSYTSNSHLDDSILRALDTPESNATPPCLPNDSRKTLLSPIPTIDRKKRRVVKKRTPAADLW
jgi:hypothetical protein